MSRCDDLVVVGGGTGGLVAATIAAGLGARVVLVERERTGGDCLWTGCVPSKALLSAARLAHGMRRAGDVGLAAVEPHVDLAAVMAHVDTAIATIAPHDSPAALRAKGVDVIVGDARLVDARTVAIDGQRRRFARAIIATGSAPARPSLPGIEDPTVLDTDSIWSLRELPQRIVVLGGGPVGCELGQAFARLGSRVTIVEQASRLLAGEEPEVSALIAGRLRGEGIEVRTGVCASAVRGAPAGAHELVVDGPGEAIGFDRLLVATGRTPRTAGLGLEAAGVTTAARGEIVVDARLRTSARGIFAVGDVVGGPGFTHVAAHHARIAVVNALLGARGAVSGVLPRVTYTDPEVAAVGLTQAQARARWGDRATLARYDYRASDRAIADGDPTGLAVLVGDPRGRLVGATVAARAAGETIAELVARVDAGDRIGALSTAVHAYPTYSEGPARAADAQLRARYAKPGYRAAARALLVARRARSVVGARGG